MSGMCVDLMCQWPCDVWFSRSNFEIAVTSKWKCRLTWHYLWPHNDRDLRFEMGTLIDGGLKGSRSIGYWVSSVMLVFYHTHDLNFELAISNFEKHHLRNREWGWALEMERKGCESIGCRTQHVTLNFDLVHNIDMNFGILARYFIKSWFYLQCSRICPYLRTLCQSIHTVYTKKYTQGVCLFWFVVVKYWSLLPVSFTVSSLRRHYLSASEATAKNTCIRNARRN